MKKYICVSKICVIVLVLMAVMLPVCVFATEGATGSTETVIENETTIPEEQNKYYLGSVVNAGHDTGFSKSKKIGVDDPHFGWELGKFYVDGYTRVTQDSAGNPVFLKTVGDTVTLWFELEQDISKLNGNKDLHIYRDENGYDEYFGVKKTNMGRGALIVRHTDYQNNATEPVIYRDYLAATASQVAAVEVKMCEEGDYEIALDYEIRKENYDIFGWNPFPDYYNYRIFIKFSVRNGNCMVYPFDIATGEELTNSAVTENGFELDLAKSRYLNIDIKKEVRREGAEGLTEDVRFNKPAKDGEQYTEEGIYTITVSNVYTNQTTIKKIYVGTDDVMKAHAATGLSLVDIEYQISQGATVAEDGVLILAQEESTEPENDISSTEKSESQSGKGWIWVALVSGIAIILVVVLIAVRKKKKVRVKKKKQQEIEAEY